MVDVIVWTVWVEQLWAPGLWLCGKRQKWQKKNKRRRNGGEGLHTAAVYQTRGHGNSIFEQIQPQLYINSDGVFLKATRICYFTEWGSEARHWKESEMV
jgi:hypothetical protein